MVAACLELWLLWAMAKPKHRVAMGVISDLVTDQRVAKMARMLHGIDFQVEVIGRQRSLSLPLTPALYPQQRLAMRFQSGPAMYAEFQWKLYRAFLASKASLIWCNDLDTLLPGLLAAKRLGAKLVYDSHELFTEVPELEHSPLKQWIWRRIEQSCISRADGVITVNASIAHELNKRYGVEAVVVRNIPEGNPLPPAALLENYGLPKDKPLLILQGAGINMHRGAEEVGEAMALLEGVHVVVMGSGDALPALQVQVQNKPWKSRISFLGVLPYAEMMSVAQHGFLGLSLDRDTNLNYRFSLPNKLFDYWAAGMPVLVSNLPEVGALVLERGAGWVLEAVEPAVIARRITEILNNSEEYYNVKNKAREAGKVLTWEKETESLRLKLKTI
jgi:glycosyltransferase involved in cell wall biosynthesis